MSTDEPADVERRVRELLAVVYTPEAVEVWLNGRSRSFDGLTARALLIAGGESALEVLREAERLAGAM